MQPHAPDVEVSPSRLGTGSRRRTAERGRVSCLGKPGIQGAAMPLKGVQWHLTPGLLSWQRPQRCFSNILISTRLSAACASSILTPRASMSRRHSSRDQTPSGSNLGPLLALQGQALARQDSRSPRSSRDGARSVSSVRRGGADPVLEGRPAWGSSGTVAPTQSPQRAAGTAFTPREPRRSREVSLRVRSRRVA